MRIIIDANVICSALLASGRTADILFSDKIEPIAPELLFEEVENHKEELLAKTKLNNEQFNNILALFKKTIRTIPLDEYKDFLLKANVLLKPHTKDTSYVALAMKYKAPLWSKEKRLKKIHEIEVLDANEVAKKIGQ